MGMPTAFTAAADFTAASPTMGRQMFISFVKQKTFVDVNETGTVAAAVTAVGVTAVSGTLNPPVSVTFDRPFVFVIRERITGAILFMGKVVRPV
jgi:serpin B